MRIAARILIVFALALSIAAPARAEMTLERLGELIDRVSEDTEREGGMWRFSVETVPVFVITDVDRDRMRIISPIRPVDGLTAEEMARILQANFDSALDARYAIAQDVVWSAYIHPLAALSDDQFLEGLGQTVNAARTYGVSYSSGLLMFRGGDSQELEQRRLIDELKKRGRDT
jgi:hypothetical protein